MRIFLDTEFVEDGRTIDLLSIGAIREDGATYYAVNKEFYPSKLFGNKWLVENVVPHLPLRKLRPADPWSGHNYDMDHANPFWRMPEQIREEFVQFAGEAPEFWTYYGAYDWVVLTQLYGRMTDLPEGWPYFARDLAQLREMVGNPDLPAQDAYEHHALYDAVWTKDAFDFVIRHGIANGHVAGL